MINLDTIKENYNYALWPKDSHFKRQTIHFNSILTKENGYHLLERYALPYKTSYEDVYEGSLPDVRISVKVINCDDFEAAKEHLIQHLAQCTAPNIPQITEKLGAGNADIVFGAYDGSCKALSIVRGHTFIQIRNIGLKSIVLDELYHVLNDMHIQKAE